MIRRSRQQPRTHPRRFTRLQWASCIALALTLGLPARAPARAARLPDVYLIVIDTLRPDHLGTYGYRRHTSPNLDRFAKTATVFDNARSTSSWTIPSLGSVFTGLYPSTHEFRAQLNCPEGSCRIRPDIPTLAEILHQAGYYTVATLGHNWFPPEAKHGTERGYDAYEVISNSPRASALAKQAERMLATAPAEQPLFTWIHFMDPHRPYDGRRLPPGTLGPIDEGQEFPPLWAEAHPHIFEWEPFREQRWRDVTHVGDVVDMYDECIHEWDEAFGTLLAWLKRHRPLDDALVVVLADHGEELWERGDFGHGRSMFEEVVRVPMIFRFPHARRRRAPIPASLLDVAPTILAAVGVPAPAMEGRDLRTLKESRWLRMESDSCPGVGNYGSCYQRALYHDGDKWSLLCKTPSCARGRLQQYDLESDPGERHPRRVDPPPEWPFERREMEPTKPPKLGPAEVERLRMLGYE